MQPCGGVTGVSLQPFRKPWKSVDEQIALLKSRGILFGDVDAARLVLRHIDYYRFSGYTYPFRRTASGSHTYPAATRFEDIQRLYHLDADLRHAVLRAIGVLEVDLRSSVVCVFAGRHGPMGHTDASRFRQPGVLPRNAGLAARRRYPDHGGWLDNLRRETKRSSEDCVHHFKSRYTAYPDVPIWVAASVMSFGTLSKMINLLVKNDLKEVAMRYGLQRTTLSSWVHHLAHARNVCAHHSRLWDRVWAVKPARPAGKLWDPAAVPDTGRLFMTLLIISQMLQQTIPTSRAARFWRSEVIDLLNEIAEIPDAEHHTGLPTNWQGHPLLA